MIILVKEKTYLHYLTSITSSYQLKLDTCTIFHTPTTPYHSPYLLFFFLSPPTFTPYSFTRSPLPLSLHSIPLRPFLLLSPPSQTLSILRLRLHYGFPTISPTPLNLLISAIDYDKNILQLILMENIFCN